MVVCQTVTGYSRRTVWEIPETEGFSDSDSAKELQGLQLSGLSPPKGGRPTIIIQHAKGKNQRCRDLAKVTHKGNYRYRQSSCTHCIYQRMRPRPVPAASEPAVATMSPPPCPAFAKSERIRSRISSGVPFLRRKGGV